MPGADDMARAELEALRERGLLRSLEPLRTPPGAEVELRPGERLINFSSNDYLGLAADARIARALAEGARAWGSGAGASRLVCGDFLPQHQLERELARFEGSESALLFGSGYAANCGILPALAGPEDLIVSDALNHASIIDGCRLSRARVEGFPHPDLDSARLLVNRARPLIYSTALPPALACAALESLRIVAGPEGDERRSRLWSNVRRFAAGLRSLGVAAREDSPIFPLMLGAPERAVETAAKLREQGILAKAIRPPTVPQGTSRIRFALTSAHTQAHIDAALAALRAC